MILQVKEHYLLQIFALVIKLETLIEIRQLSYSDPQEITSAVHHVKTEYAHTIYSLLLNLDLKEDCEFYMRSYKFGEIIIYLWPSITRKLANFDPAKLISVFETLNNIYDTHNLIGSKES